MWSGPRTEVVRRLLLRGRVLAANGHAAPGAMVELWHADPWGRYHHPSATGEPPLAGFTGYGCVRTDAEGRFEFRSVVPGGYAGEGMHRAPHLHVQITGRYDRLVTQLFLPGHASNADDRSYLTLRDPSLVTLNVMSDPQTGADLALRWTAVLSRG
jgi:protocatechuate 3,4-dioxygenase beta subunit